MDSEIQVEGRLMDIIDQAWKDDILPHEDIDVPQMELPELEPDNGNNNETLREQEQKWTDLACGDFHDQPRENPTN
jgi:anaphase-promoting complex subunit 13